MEWRDFFENIFLTESSILIEKIPLLKSMGPSSEIIMAIGHISLDGSKEQATLLLEKALQMNVTFTADEMGQISCNCSKDGCKKAFYKSVEKFTTEDLEELYLVIEDEWVIDAAKKYNIALPECFREVNEDRCEEKQEEYEAEFIESKIETFKFGPKKRRKKSAIFQMRRY